MSEADSSWYLRHRDGVEHGPFQLADIVAAAKAGNVASDTSVRHEVHTRGQWVLANRVQPIAHAMSRGSEPASAPSQRPPQGTSASVSAKPSQPSPPRKPASTRDTTADPPPSHPSDDDVATASDASIQQDVAPSVTLRDLRGDAFPVPKTFMGAVQTLLVDFRFQRFVTPWIIEIVWAMCLAVAILSTLKLGYDMLIQPSMSAPDPAAVRGNWQFQPLAEQSGLLIRILVFATWGVLTTLVILGVRVAFEMIIVVFRTSGDVAELRKLMKRPK